MGFGTGFYTPSTGGSGGSGTATALSPTVLSAGYNKTLIVTKTGDNATATGAADKPFLTIQAALNYASSSYTNFGESVIVVVGPGSYNENITISRYNTYITSQLTRPDQRAVSIIGTVTVNCPTANSKYNQIVGLQGLFISNSTTSPSLKVTGTAEHLTYIKDCYIAGANTNTAANCLFLDSSLTFAKSKVMVENSTLLNQQAGPDIVKISGGDVGLDSIRLLTSGVTGTGNGITQNGNSVLLADRVQIDMTTNGKCLSISSTYPTAPTTASCYFSNSSATVRGASSNEVIQTSNSILLWNVLLAGATKTAVSGSGAGSVYLSYNNVVSGNPLFQVTTGSLTPVKLPSI